MQERAHAWRRLSLGLLVTPVAVSLAILLTGIGEWPPALADALAFGGAAGVTLTALSVAATAEVALALGLGFALAAALTLSLVALLKVTGGPAFVVVDTALVTLAWALGASLGRRVQHASHLLPAAVVAASADSISLLSPEGPSHAIVESERALSVLAVWFPVPGAHALAPVLGVGDLLFIAFVLGAARTHRLSYARAVACCVAGVAVAGAASAWLRAPIPALVPIAAALITGLPQIRKLRPRERRTAFLSMTLAVSLALAAFLRSVLGA